MSVLTAEAVVRLRHVRWAVRAALTIGVAASVAANVLHAQPDPVAQVIAGWPPCALLLTVELVSRVPVHRRWLAALRVLATVVIAGIAGWVSYWHMADVASRYGESATSALLLPVSVDGLIVVASICLVELSGRIDHAEASHVSTPSIVAGPAKPSGVGGGSVAAAGQAQDDRAAVGGATTGPERRRPVSGIGELSR